MGQESGTLKVAVVGGGIAGLSAAWALRKHAVETGRPVEVRLFEAAPRLGGKIETERRDGFLLEGGPDSFVTRKPQAVELARELGLGHRLIDTDPSRNRVWMVRHGKLTEIPPSMGHILPCRLAPIWGSQLLSWPGKLRMALDLVLPRRRAVGDESLGSFLRRRFGKEMVDRLAGPLLAGIYVADPESLSLAATFPHFAEIERRHGSVMRGLRASLSRHDAGHPSPQPGARGAVPGSAPAPTATRASLAGGIGELTDALVAALDQPAPPADIRLHTSTPVRQLHPPAAADAPWQVDFADSDDPQSWTCDAVILALPAFAAADLLQPFAPEPAATLAAIPYVSTATVSLGYRTADLPRPLDGYGFVVPAAEKRRITACTWSSAKFPDRASEGHALLRVFMGGAFSGELHGEHYLEADDATLIQTAREELADLMGLPLEAHPTLTTVHRHPRSTPQYQVGHAERIAEAQTSLPPTLHLAGSAFHGIGIPDCIRSAHSAAAKLCSEDPAFGSYEETRYLQSSPRNAARLQKAIDELRFARGQNDSHDN